MASTYTACTFSDATYRSHVEQTFTYDVLTLTVSRSSEERIKPVSARVYDRVAGRLTFTSHRWLRQRGIHWATLTRILCFPFDVHVPSRRSRNIRESVYRECIPLNRSAPPLQIM